VLDRGGERRSANRVDDQVELVLDALDDVSCAQTLQRRAVRLDVADERGHHRAGERCELHRVASDASGGSGDEDSPGEEESAELERA
jgi:hypothetical protein